MKVDVNGEFRDALLRLKSSLATSRERRIPRRVSIDAVDAALQRIEAETFGACGRCFKLIPRAELFMRPYTEYCSACARAEP